MSFSGILQRRMKPLKYAIEEEGYIKSHEQLLSSDGGEEEFKESYSQNESIFQSSGEKDVTLGNDDIEDDFQSMEPDIDDIPFGALARAQEDLLKMRDLQHPGHSVNSPPRANPLIPYIDAEAEERKAGKKDLRDFSRSSKHSPAELSSKKAVSRRREVVQARRLDHRDPRFEPLSGPIDEAKLKKNYSFLEDYRDSEITELRAAVLKNKDVDSVEKLKKVLQSLESRKKTEAAKDQEQAVLRVYRAKEKELVMQGKRPFYLKRREQKRLALVQRFEGLKDKQVDKVVEKRRKKKTMRERRGLPEGRRM